MYKDKIIIISLLVYAILLLSFSFIGFSNPDKVIYYTITFFVSFGLYTVVYFRLRNKPEVPLKQILYTAIALRALLLFIEPITTDDYYRYMWDGKMQAEGINPYQYAPNDETVKQYRINEKFSGVNNPNIKTIYPPVAQVIFLVSYLISGFSIWGLKILYILFDLGAILFLYKSLKQLSRNTNNIILYAFAPIILFEIFLNAHVDVLQIFFLAGCFYFYTVKRTELSFLFLGLAVMSKFFSIMFLPMLLYPVIKEKKFKEIALYVLFLTIPALSVIPYLDHFSNIFVTIRTYSEYWYFNNLLYRLPNELIFIPNGYGNNILRIILFSLTVLSALWIALSKYTFQQKIYLTIMAFFVFAHTVHPWYMTLGALAVTLYFGYTFFFWTGFITLTSLSYYHYISKNIWGDVDIIIYIEYSILLVLILIDLMKLKTANE